MTTPHTGLVVEPRDHGRPRWVFRCWGTDTCDGALSLDHDTESGARAARDRHVAEEHDVEDCEVEALLAAMPDRPATGRCTARLVHTGAQWACDRPAGHPGGHSAGERGAVGYQAWTDHTAGACPVAGHRCPYCGHATTGQAFSGGREWYCPGCEAVEEYPDQRPAPASCPGDETAPNTCRCACEGCRHHCGAHQDDAAAGGECGPECAEQHTYGPGCGAQIHNGQTDNGPIVDEAPAPPAGALRDRIAEAIHATSVCEIGDPARCGGGCRDVADVVLPVIEQHTAQLRSGRATWRTKAEEIERDRDRLDDELDRRADLHADTERQLRVELRAAVERAEQAETAARTLRGLHESAEAAVTRVHEHMQNLDQMAESTASPNDRRLYQALAGDLRKRLGYDTTDTPKEAEPMSTCTATITGPHGPDGAVVYCDRDAGHANSHVGLATDGHGDIQWVDGEAGATPHDPSARYSTEPPLSDIPPGHVSDIPPL